MKNTEFIPADYDTQGRLRLPLLFWGVLLLQARTWVLFVMAGASRQQGDALLSLFYPDHDNFWLLMRWLLMASQALLLAWQTWLWFTGEAPSTLTIALLAADIYALWWLITSRRLHACFRLEAL